MSKYYKAYFRVDHLKNASDKYRFCDYKTCYKPAELKLIFYNKNFKKKDIWYICKEHSKFLA